MIVSSLRSPSLTFMIACGPCPHMRIGQPTSQLSQTGTAFTTKTKSLCQQDNFDYCNCMTVLTVAYFVNAVLERIHAVGADA